MLLNAMRIYFQVSFVFLGVLTMLIVVVQNYYALIAVCLTMGIFDGCFVSLMGPVAFKICGQKGASQAIGFLLGLCSIPMTLGPPIAGTKIPGRACPPNCSEMGQNMLRLMFDEIES